MRHYIISEIPDRSSFRQGSKIKATCLQAAKKRASKMQCFEKTVMRIETETGAILSEKINGKWQDVDSEDKYDDVRVSIRGEAKEYLDKLCALHPEQSVTSLVNKIILAHKDR